MMLHINAFLSSQLLSYEHTHCHMFGPLRIDNIAYIFLMQKTCSQSSSVMVTVVVVEAVLIMAWGVLGLMPINVTVKSWSPSNSVSVCMVKVAHSGEGVPPTGNTTVGGAGDTKSSGSTEGK